jgi:hypothetical protein
MGPDCGNIFIHLDYFATRVKDSALKLQRMGGKTLITRTQNGNGRDYVRERKGRKGQGNYKRKISRKGQGDPWVSFRRAGRNPLRSLAFLLGWRLKSI